MRMSRSARLNNASVTLAPTWRRNAIRSSWRRRDSQAERRRGSTWRKPSPTSPQTEATIPQFCRSQLRQAENRLCVLMGMPPQDMTRAAGRAERFRERPPRSGGRYPRRPHSPSSRRASRGTSSRRTECSYRYRRDPISTPHSRSTAQSSCGPANSTDLFRSRRSAAGNVGPSFNWNVFNYGRIRNLVRVEEARFEQRVDCPTNGRCSLPIAKRKTRSSRSCKLKSRAWSSAKRGRRRRVRDLVNEPVSRWSRGLRSRVRRGVVPDAAARRALAVAQGAIAPSMVDDRTAPSAAVGRFA